MLQKLQKIGLSEKESTIYLVLARLGEATANQLAKETSTNRTVTYNILQQLVEKGLITYIHRDKRRIFRTSRPESLIVSIKEKEIIACELINDIKKIPQIPLIFKSVEVYEGLEGMKVIHNEIRKAKELLVLNATGLIFDYLKYSAGHIVKEIESFSNCKVIGVLLMKKTLLPKYKGLKIKYLPKSAENYATTFIFEGKVIIQVLREKPFLIRIENKDIWEGYKKDFELLWGIAK